MTDLLWIRPSCLEPILIVAILKDGTSKIPLEEFPTTPSIYLRIDK